MESKPKITAAQIETNSKASFAILEEQQKCLVACMEPSFKGLLTAEEFEGFWDYRTTYFKQLLNLNSFKDSPSLHDRIKDLMDYSCSMQNHSPPALFLNFYKHFKPELLKHDTDKAHYVAWTVYLLNTIYYPIDDITDGATMRRFKSAYFVVNGINVTWLRTLLVFNLMVEGLQEKFKSDSYGFELSRLFAYTTSRATVGQVLDLENFGSSKQQFDMEYRLHHNDCFTCPVYSLPFEAAAIMAGRKLMASELTQIRYLALAICNLFRDNNDLVDSFPNLPHGKPLYSDIRNGTCSWLSATAYQRANKEQRQTLEENYGSDDNEKIAKVLQVYIDLDMEAQFQLELPAKMEKIIQLVNEFPEDLAPKETFRELLAYARKNLCLAWS